MTAYEKMSKKAKKAYNAQKRTRSMFNTGTRSFKSSKDYNRQAMKKEARSLASAY